MSKAKTAQEVATELAANFSHPDVAKVEAVNGYLNFTMTSKYWVDQLEELRQWCEATRGRIKK